jgi:hypothetical protein
LEGSAVKSRRKTNDRRIDEFRLVRQRDRNEYGLERRTSETYLGSQLLERRVVQTIGTVSLAVAAKRMPRVPIWASQTTVRVDCHEVVRVQDGIPHRRVTYWEVYVGTSPPKKLRRLGQETYVGDSLMEETDFYSNGNRARRCVYFAHDPVRKRCYFLRPDGTKEKELLVHYRKDGSRTEEETRYDEQGHGEPGTFKREYDADGNLVSEQGPGD